VLARHYKYDEYKQASKEMFAETDVEMELTGRK
jgi:hypothetical protein